MADQGGSTREYDQLFIRHWDTWAEPGVRSRIFAFVHISSIDSLGADGTPTM